MELPIHTHLRRFLPDRMEDYIYPDEVSGHACILGKIERQEIWEYEDQRTHMYENRTTIIILTAISYICSGVVPGVQ